MKKLLLTAFLMLGGVGLATVQLTCPGGDKQTCQQFCLAGQTCSSHIFNSITNEQICAESKLVCSTAKEVTKTNVCDELICGTFCSTVCNN